MKSSWGAAVAECCNAMRQIGAGGLVRSGPSGIGQEALPANHRDRRLQAKLTPFAIRFQPPTDDSDAQWIIYLPSELILTVSNTSVSPFGDLEPVPEMTDWYILDAIPHTGGVVYLNIATSTDPASVAYATEPSDDISIAVADVSYDEESKVVVIKQYITSAIHLGGGGEARWKDPDPIYWEDE